jgi:hypothetical protein
MNLSSLNILKISLALILLLISKSIFGATAYIGIVGVGKGAGTLGHLFILIHNNDKESSILTADGYNYTVHLDKEQQTPLYLVNLEKFNFYPEKTSFYNIYYYYTKIENRTISLFKLKLDEKSINKLVELLDKDLTSDNFSRQDIYGFNNNCVTRPIELINKVVSPDLQIALDFKTSFSITTSQILSSLK